VVHLLRLETNRATGYSASLLAPYTADPGFLRLEALREPKLATWHIDKQKGVAYLDPDEFKGPRIELPLRPMLGCVGTAPANKAAIPTTFPDNFGGNMDYNGMGAGATVMLPVFEPGALFFLGDGQRAAGRRRSSWQCHRDLTRRRILRGPRQTEKDQLAPPRKPGLHHGAGQFTSPQ
jgi:acetamidase/formamidase